MSWGDDNGNKGPWGGSPWGKTPPPRGNGGRRFEPPPNFDFEVLIKKIQEWIRGKSGSSGSGKGFYGKKQISILIAIILLLWLGSGFYRVQPDEQGVVLRFGEFVKNTQPGLNYHIPFPIESVLTPKVTKVNKVEIGFRSSANSATNVARDVVEESLMLTGDENIVNIDFAVFWVIKNAGYYLFNIQRPESTVKAVAESAMREVIGRSNIQSVFTEGRFTVEKETHSLIQTILDQYNSGIEITQVKMQKADPPDQVIDAFRDVQAARADLERQRNEAEAYANDVIPRARGKAEEILQQAEGYKQKVIADAEGIASRFLAVQEEHAKAPDVTRQRIFLETMESVFGDMQKVIVDSQAGSGVIPYLPLPELQKKSEDTNE